MATSTKSWEFTTVAELDDQASGILQTSEPSLRMSPSLFMMAIRVYGPLFVRKLMPRIRLLNQVQTIAPPGAYVHFRIQFVQGHHFIDQSHFQGFLSGIAVAEHPHFSGRLGAGGRGGAGDR